MIETEQTQKLDTDKQWDERRLDLTQWATHQREFEDPIHNILQWEECPAPNFEEANRVSIGCTLKRRRNSHAKGCIIAIEIVSLFREEDETVVYQVRHEINSEYGKALDKILLESRQYAVMETFLVGHYRKWDVLHRESSAYPDKDIRKWPVASNRL